MRRAVIGFALAIIALVGVVWILGVSTREITLPAVNNSRAEGGRGPVAFRCESPASETALEAAKRATEAEFFHAIIQAAPYADQGNTLVVERLTIQVPAHRRFETWDPAASVLLLDGIAQCVELMADQFPAGVKFINTADVQSHLKPQPSGHTVPDQVFAFSRARFDSAERNAVVYYERRCHRCGIGEYIWFQRGSSGDAWRVAGRQLGWIN